MDDDVRASNELLRKQNLATSHSELRQMTSQWTTATQSPEPELRDGVIENGELRHAE